MRRVVLVVAIAACSRGKSHPQGIIHIPTNNQSESEALHRERLRAELSDDVLASYERGDEPPDATDMLRREIGGARIGFGPDDLWVGDDVARAPSRWRRDPPAVHDKLYIDRDSTTELRSKQLRITIAADDKAAWVSDELSWRVAACGHTAVIPLRSTALYAHDGDRWIPVFEHASFARQLRAQVDGSLRGKGLKSESVRDVADPLSGVLQRSLAGRADSTQPIADDAELIGPDLDAWYGGSIREAKIGTGPIRAEERRVGTVGRSVGRATVAYWIGNFSADTPGGKVRLRGTFVFEKRDETWVLAQGHLSQPIDDGDLAIRVFGTALVALDPLRLSCDDGPKLTPKPQAPGA